MAVPALKLDFEGIILHVHSERMVFAQELARRGRVLTTQDSELGIAAKVRIGRARAGHARCLEMGR